MEDQSFEILVSYLDEPPEMDSDQNEIEKNIKNGLFESSKADIIYNIGKNLFKDTWLILKDDIQKESIRNQVIFAEQIMDKIFEVYDFKFPINITLENQFELDNFYKFIEFLEYNNLNFLTQVWQFLQEENLIKLDIEKFCKSNALRIIREINEQLDLHPQPKLISLFLRTLYKEKIIEWFSTQSKRVEVEITVNISF